MRSNTYEIIIIVYGVRQGSIFGDKPESRDLLSSPTNCKRIPATINYFIQHKRQSDLNYKKQQFH